MVTKTVSLLESKFFYNKLLNRSVMTTVQLLYLSFRQSGFTVKLLPKCMCAKQGGSLYHLYDGLWYDPAETRTCNLPCERRTR